MLQKRNIICDSRILSLALILTSMLLSQLALAECLPGQMQEANLAYQSAASFLSAQQWDQAIARLQSIVDVCPEHVDATRGLGTAYAGKNDHAMAVQWFKMVIELRDSDAEAGDYAYLAKSYAKQKKYKEARAEYMKAQRLNPDDCGVLFNLGVMHYASSDHVNSVKVLLHALDVCPQIREHVVKQLTKSASAAAEQQKRAGNNAKAEYYQGLLNQHGGAAGGSTSMDVVRQKMKAKDYPAAVKLLEEMLANDPNQPNATLTLARAADAAGDKTRSIEAYQAYLKMKPNKSKAAAAMLQVMSEAGRCSEANQAAAAAVQKFQAAGRKALGGIYYSWGLALECLEDYEGAKSKFASAAASGDSRYAGPGQQQVGRMDDFIALKKAEKKKANQGG